MILIIMWYITFTAHFNKRKESIFMAFNCIPIGMYHHDVLECKFPLAIFHWNEDDAPVSHNYRGPEFQTF